MTAEQLGDLSVKDLGQLAKQRGVPGWHGMRKVQLIKALTKVLKSRPKRSAKKASATKAKSPGVGNSPKRKAANRSTPKSASSRKTAGTKSARSRSTKAAQRSKPKSRAAVAKPKQPKKTPRQMAISRKLQKEAEVQRRQKELGNVATNGKPVEDRLVVMVRDSYWLHVYWELSPQGVARAEAALGQEWHGARPVLRLSKVTSDGSRNSTDAVIKHIAIHGGVNHWYVNVDDPPQSYRLDIGYLAESGRMFVLARSNTVTTPEAGVADSLDENWSDVARDAEKVFAMSGGHSTNGASGELKQLMEERLRRPMSAPVFPDRLQVHRGDGERQFEFEIDAEMIVYGRTTPGARVTLAGDPVKLRNDGTFTVRFNLPNCRQVIPAVADSSDGVERRTVVLAVERNTKSMEPIMRDGNDS
ncbi:MAG: DUF4912 domain-containing protein [Pirellulales bacterium]|nr:DUF4912 domain-containing protein [Pirellulales bacterium]